MHSYLPMLTLFISTVCNDLVLTFSLETHLHLANYSIFDMILLYLYDNTYYLISVIFVVVLYIPPEIDR